MKRELSIEEKIGQMLLVGIYGFEIDNYTLKFIKDYKVGGIILFGRNIANLEQMQKLINEIKKINRENNNIPMFIAIDQEGGRVNRLPKEILNFPTGSKIGEENNEEYSYLLGKKISIVLRKIGLNMNLAPVLDLRTMEKSNHAIGDRAISTDEKIVANQGTQIIKAMQDEKVIAVAKHFPGHGMTVRDTHYTLPIITEKVGKMSKHLEPFKLAINNGLDAILTSHIIIKYIDMYKPITLSKYGIKHLIRKKIKYDGVVITDDLMMRSLSFYDVFGIPIKDAVEAGNDIILLCKDNRKKEKAIKEFINQVKNEKIRIDEIDKSVERILKLKEKYNINDDSIEYVTAQEINEIVKEKI